MIVLTLVIAVSIVFVVGLFAFELNRVEVARGQLRSATEAASLSAVATLASQQSANTMLAHTEAVATALNTYRQNEVIGVEFDGSDPDDGNPPAAISAPTNPYDPPIPKQASLFIEFLDPNSTPPNQVVPMGDDRGKAIRCYGTFHYVPAFSNFVGVGNTFLRAMSTGGVPDLDVILCLDISGSIDDQTIVTYVKRFRKVGANAAFVGDNTLTVPAGGTATRYFIANDPNGSNGGKCNGTIYSIVDPPATGTSCNALYPQGLDLADNNANPGLDFLPICRGATNNSIPGNTGPTGGTNVGDSSDFTDMVVNLDGNTVYGGGTYGGYNFPNVAVLVEASRGNLENAAVFNTSGAQTAFTQLGIAVGPSAGYQAAYLAQAFNMARPINDAKVAAQQFYTLMNTNTKGHFGLVSFTTVPGSSSGDTHGPANRIASNYGAGGSQSYPRPMIALNPAPLQTGYTACLNAIPGLVACASTNFGDTLATCRTQLTTNQRPNAKRAIVFFTDGQPTAGPDPRTNGTCTQLANDGIPVYTIGLAQVTAIVQGEVNNLNDGGIGSQYNYTDPITGLPQTATATENGISKICANGGRFYLVTNSGNLGVIFGNIARSLCGLVK
jgi:hypothetical protein